MKTCLFLISLVFVASCTEASLKSPSSDNNSVIGTRSDENELVFGVGISKTSTFNDVTGEFEYTIDSDFEIKPYGELNWVQFSGAKRIKVKCKCAACAHGDCIEVISETDPVVAGCDNQCGVPYYTCGCKMKIRVTSIDNNDSIAEYEGGASIELQ